MSTSTRPFHLLLPLVFVGGLLLGWLVIGWWLWPVRWANVAPAQLSPNHQQTYVAMAAEAYALTGDAAQAQSRLATWDDETLAATLTLLLQNTTDPLARDRYVALAEALAMPQVDLSLMDVILGQKAILITAVAAVGLFSTALGMALFPILQQTRARQQEELRLLNSAEAKTDPDEDEQTAVSSRDAARQTNARTETGANAGQGNPPDSAANATPQPNTSNQANATPQPNATPQANATDQAKAGGGAGQSGAAQAAVGKQAQQNPANAAAPPPEQQATAVYNPAIPPQPVANQPPPEETAEKLLAETTGDIQALLNSVFDEDDKLAHYDTLLHNMGDVDMIRLADRSAQVLRQLRQKNREIV